MRTTAPSSIAKILSGNDLGTTGTHQAGICVPRNAVIQAFFPALPLKEKNPRAQIVVRELTTDVRWQFNYIYYNNRFFGGTRNEYRLTGTTAFLRSIAAEVGDELVFHKDENGSIIVALRRKDGALRDDEADDVLVLSGGWVVIKLN